MTIFTFQAPPSSKEELEAGTQFTPRLSDDGLITVVTLDNETGEVVMVAHMNADALSLTLETGIAHYWSRSRQSLWKKGETSGNQQLVKEIRTDCDQDVLTLRVETQGDNANCHTGRKTCFYRIVDTHDGVASLRFDANRTPIFDPEDVYGKS
ncbi:MAG: phosphoribosyl-AMP cyclohydrolase [Pseudomonadota bacterium]